MNDILVTRDGLYGNSPRYTGYLSPPYQKFLKDDGGYPIDLTGLSTSSFTITFINQSDPTIIKAGTGEFSIIDPASQGLMSYAYGYSDLAAAGNWYIFVTVQLPGEPTPRVFDPDTLSIQAFPGGSYIVTIQNINLTEVNGTAVSTSNPLPISIADGANSTQGTTTDSSSANTTIGLLKAIKAYLAGTLTVGVNTLPTSTTGTITSITAVTSSTALLASDGTRKGGLIYNDSTSAMYVAFANTASTSAFSVKIPAYSYLEIPPTPVYTGPISALWDVAVGSAHVTVLS